MTSDDSAFELARHGVIPFSIAMSKEFRRARHLQLIANKLEDLERRKIKRLMIFMPPRHGKSHLISNFFPAWYLGRNPGDRIIFTTYAAEVASDVGRNVRNMFSSDIYQSIFPNIAVSGDSNAANRFTLTTGGVYYGVGAAGSLTGRGGNLIIVDDIHKNRDEANSVKLQKRIHKWFGSTLYTRLLKNGVMIVVQTRWCENDLPGYILREMKDQGWETLSLPAIRDTEEGHPSDIRGLDEPLWPEMFPKGTLLDIKHTIGSNDFESLYQQRPTALEGGIIKREWLKFYKTRPGKFDEIIMSLDCTFKATDASDFVVLGVWGRLGANKYLLDLWRERAGFVATAQALKTMAAKWPDAMTKIVEDKANGSAVIETLKNEIPGIIAYSPKESKSARLNAVSPEFEAGNVFLPEAAGNPWVHDYIEELCTFPNGVNDDQVDMTTQALLRFRSGGSGEFAANMVPRAGGTIANRTGDDY